MFVYKLLMYENGNKSLKKFTGQNDVTRDFEKRVMTYLNCAYVLKRSVESGIYAAFCFCCFNARGAIRERHETFRTCNKTEVKSYLRAKTIFYSYINNTVMLSKRRSLQCNRL